MTLPQLLGPSGSQEMHASSRPIAAVLIIGGAHYTQLKPDLKGMPILTILNRVPETDPVEEFIRHLSRKWAAFERQPLIPLGTTDLPKLRFRAVSADVKEAARR